MIARPPATAAGVGMLTNKRTNQQTNKTNKHDGNFTKVCHKTLNRLEVIQSHIFWQKSIPGVGPNFRCISTRFRDITAFVL